MIRKLCDIYKEQYTILYSLHDAIALTKYLLIAHVITCQEPMDLQRMDFPKIQI